MENTKLKNDGNEISHYVQVDTENRIITIHLAEDNLTNGWIFSQLFIVDAMARRENGGKFEDVLTLANISHILETLGFNHEFVQKR